MLITLEKLKEIKKNLPSGGFSQIAKKLNMEEQDIRDFFEVSHASSDQTNSWYRKAGPSRDTLKIENPIILQVAKELINESQKLILESNIAIKDSRKLLK